MILYRLKRRAIRAISNNHALFHKLRAKKAPREQLSGRFDKLMSISKRFYALKISMVSPSARVTMAFFQVRVLPAA